MIRGCRLSTRASVRTHRSAPSPGVGISGPLLAGTGREGSHATCQRDAISCILGAQIRILAALIPSGPDAQRLPVRLDGTPTVSELTGIAAIWWAAERSTTRLFTTAHRPPCLTCPRAGCFRAGWTPWRDVGQVLDAMTAADYPWSSVSPSLAGAPSSTGGMQRSARRGPGSGPITRPWRAVQIGALDTLKNVHRQERGRHA
jgi:hypothetical protein